MTTVRATSSPEDDVFICGDLPTEEVPLLFSTCRIGRGAAITEDSGNGWTRIMVEPLSGSNPERAMSVARRLMNAILMRPWATRQRQAA